MRHTGPASTRDPASRGTKAAARGERVGVFVARQRPGAIPSPTSSTDVNTFVSRRLPARFDYFCCGTRNRGNFLRHTDRCISAPPFTKRRAMNPALTGT